MFVIFIKIDYYLIFNLKKKQLKDITLFMFIMSLLLLFVLLFLLNCPLLSLLPLSFMSSLFLLLLKLCLILNRFCYSWGE